MCTLRFIHKMTFRSHYFEKCKTIGIVFDAHYSSLTPIKHKYWKIYMSNIILSIRGYLKCIA